MHSKYHSIILVLRWFTLWYPRWGGRGDTTCWNESVAILFAWTLGDTPYQCMRKLGSLLVITSTVTSHMELFSNKVRQTRWWVRRPPCEIPWHNPNPATTDIQLPNKDEDRDSSSQLLNSSPLGLNSRQESLTVSLSNAPINVKSYSTQYRDGWGISKGFYVKLCPGGKAFGLIKLQCMMPSACDTSHIVAWNFAG